MINYDNAREAWLREIQSDELQPIPPNFLENLRRSIEEVEGRIGESGGNEPLRSLLMAEGERLKVFHDQIVQERLSKLFGLASLGKEPRNISDDEKKLFEEVRRLSDPYKERFYRILKEETVDFPPVETTPEPTKVQPAGTGLGTEPSEGFEHRKESHPEADRNEMLRVLVDFPRFVGPDLKNYGPFGREDVIALPDEVSEILLSRRVGERIKPAGEGP